MKALFTSGVLTLIVMFISSAIDHALYGRRVTLLTYFNVALMVIGVLCVVAVAIGALIQWGFDL